MTELEIQRLNDSQNELKWCISRLSFVGMGLSDELDAILKTLRDAIKDDADSETIKQLTEKISRLLLSIEDEEQPGKVEVAGVEEDFSSLLQDTRLPTSLIAKLKQAQKNTHNDSAIKIARSMVEIIFDYLHLLSKQNTVESIQIQQESASEDAGFFARLLRRRPKRKAPDDTPENTAELSIVLDALRDSLQQLVNQLSSMENYGEIARKLTDKVSGLSSVVDLVDILELITSAFAEVSTQEHQQLENFLKSLSQRIDRVNGFVHNTMAFSHQVSEDTRQLDVTLQGSVSEIRDSVEKTKLLDTVKASLYGKMDGIIEAVHLFRQQQEKNQLKLNQDIESLHEQLRATHDESSRLRDEIAAQRMRAQTDPLTRLPNRYSYNERLTQEYNRWRRYRSSLSLVICDIDYFKRINDQHGHAAGDEVLKVVANYLQVELRESDFVARFGGEEFVMLLPETSLVKATKAMNKLRLGLKELVIEYEKIKISTAMSFGIAEFENSDTPKAVFARADRALYRAKEKGRDQVCCQRAKGDQDD